MRRLLFVTAVACGSFLIGSAQAEVTRATVFGWVREFVEENPDVIMESMAKYAMKERIIGAANSITSNTPTAGPADAAVTVVEYSEFQCPYCKRAQETLKELRRKYKNNVRFAFKHMPLAFHPQAKPAALAAVAAHKQDKFWEYSALLWENQQYLGEKLLVESAKKVGLDMDQFEKDRKSPMAERTIQKDLEDAANAGASGTPYFLINGVPMSGAQPYDRFVEAIEAALAEQDAIKNKN